MEPASAGEAWDMPTCSKFQPMKRSQHPLGIKTSGGAKYYVPIMRQPRKCLAWRATPNYGKQITFSNKWQTKSRGDTPSAPQTSVRISAKQVSRSMIHTSAGKVPFGRDAITAADVWWDVGTMPKIHYPRIIYILRRRMEPKLFRKQK